MTQARTRAKKPRAAPETPVVTAVKRDLAEIRRRSPDLADSGLAAAALVLARELDSPQNSATSKSMCARALREVLDRVRELAPPLEESDSLDDLASRRQKRITKGDAGTKGL